MIHLLLHYYVANALCSDVFTMFEIQFGWRNWFGKCYSKNKWSMEAKRDWCMAVAIAFKAVGVGDVTNDRETCDDFITIEMSRMLSKGKFFDHPHPMHHPLAKE